MEVLSQIVGWIGAGLVVLAYILISGHKVTGRSRTYQGLNFFGAIGVGVNAWYQQAWPSLAIQIVWGVIAILVILNVTNFKNTNDRTRGTKTSQS